MNTAPNTNTTNPTNTVDTTDKAYLVLSLSDLREITRRAEKYVRASGRTGAAASHTCAVFRVSTFVVRNGGAQHVDSVDFCNPRNVRYTV